VLLKQQSEKQTLIEGLGLH